jgi:hypothetical protein
MIVALGEYSPGMSPSHGGPGLDEDVPVGDVLAVTFGSLPCYSAMPGTRLRMASISASSEMPCQS